MKKLPWRPMLAGAAAGALNGLLGAGGGMLLVPLLRRSVDRQKLFPTCVAVILPLCAVSAGFYALHDALPLNDALPFLLGGALGGLLAGTVCKKIPTVLLQKCFALFLLWGGVRLLL